LAKGFVNFFWPKGMLGFAKLLNGADEKKWEFAGCVL
jgi:hypothetical protein